MNEFSLIKKYFDKQYSDENILVGIGDDCAVLLPPKGQRLVVSMDTHVAGRHFPNDAAPGLIAARALHCAMSDLAAMGAEPLWFTLGLTLPHAEPAWLAQFSQGLFTAADDYGIKLIGGDTTKGPLTISIQVHGSVPPEQILLRSGAKPGDQIFASGTLGDGAAGLAVVDGSLKTDDVSANYLRKRYYEPKARIKTGLLLRYLASAAIDISDGLIADLGHLCSASGVGAKLDSSRLPISAELLASTPTRQALEWALIGGDDYQLCFTVGPDQAEMVRSQSKARAIDATWIGEIVAQEGIVDSHTGKAYRYETTGYSHF